MQPKYKKKSTYFIVAGMFVLIGIVGAVMVEMRGLPKSAMLIILLATFGSAGKQLVWYYMNRDCFLEDDDNSHQL
ncbi:hypothetical protein [Chakrabartyella piscis]|uniref:hypothetical protein n=1 Tax=Chakrabartyella piscis TaxID=2918914 RepID=UPI002958A045|nr:hypothetical protein [Chakrabartyella piscis]